MSSIGRYERKNLLTKGKKIKRFQKRARHASKNARKMKERKERKETLESEFSDCKGTFDYKAPLSKPEIGKKVDIGACELLKVYLHQYLSLYLYRCLH